MDASDDISIFQLITRLCQSQCHDYNQKRLHGAPLGEDAVRRMRNAAFEVLLQKGPSESANRAESAEDDPLREFHYHQFDMRLRAQTAFDRDRCVELEDCMDELLHESAFFQSDSGQSVLMFLLLLKNSVASDIETSVMDLYPFGFYSKLQSCTETNPYIGISSDMHRIPRKFQVHAANQYKQLNPYMPNPLIFVGPGDPKYERLDYFFKLNFELPSPERQRKVFALSGTPSTDSQPDESSEPVKVTVHEPAPMCLSWNHLGNTSIGSSYERPFCSEHPDSLWHILNHLHLTRSNAKYQPKIVAGHIYLSDIKYLCTGVQSESFVFDEQLMTFSASVEGLTIKNVAVDTMKEHVKGFLEFGTCFKRLEIVSSVNVESLEMSVKGFVFKAVSNAITKFLFSIRHFVFNGPEEETILEFSMRVHKFARILTYFAKLLQIHPQDVPAEELPFGSGLLAHLFEALVDAIHKRDIMVALITILRDCCQSYYQLFQKWIFNGILIDPYKELFISYYDEHKIKTKYHFDKSFYLQYSEVPAFLKGFEQDILLCGKYTMLLHEYKPNHKLFCVEETPEIRVCLSYEETAALKRACTKYLKEGYRLCGGKINVKTLFEEKRAKQTALRATISAKFRHDLVRWEGERLEERNAAQEAKRLQLDQLREQIQEKRMDTLERKKKEIALEVECREYDQQQKELELENEVAARKIRIEHYEELNRMAEEKKGIMDRLVVELETELGTVRDVCNENYRKQLQEQADREQDRINANMEHVKNKTKILGSELGDILDEKRLVVNVPSTSTATPAALTEAQKNKMKVLSDEFHLENYANCDNKEKALVALEKEYLTEAQRNRVKEMSHSFNNNSGYVDEDEIVVAIKDGEMTTFEKNRLSAMSHHLTDNYLTRTTISTPSTPAALTDRERNKLKVLSHEFNINVTVEKSLAGQFEQETMTELQKNRKRILYGSLSADGGDTVKRNLDLDLNRLSDKEKNRRKYFESELGNALSTSMTASTPMSTTSDTVAATVIEEVGVSVSDASPPQDVIPIDSTDGISIEQELHAIPEPVTVPKVIPKSFMESIRETLSLPECAFFGADDEDEAKNVQQNEKSPEQLRLDLKRTSLLTVENVNAFLQQSLTIPLKTQLELVNNEVLKMYLIDLDIVSHFHSLRNYFFLMDGEFGIHICEGLISALEQGMKPRQLYSYQTLNTVLEQAFGASVMGKDKNGNRLSFALSNGAGMSANGSDHFDLRSPNVLADLELTYHVDWPLNLILCQRTVQQYSTIFQYLLKLRRISWVLENGAYKALQFEGRRLGNGLMKARQYRHVQLVRHKLAQFVNCLKNHISSSAIQSCWKRFTDELEKVTSMIDLYNKHAAYVKQIRFLCMLNRQSLEFHNVIDDIFKLILRFCRHLKSADWTRVVHSKTDDITYLHPNYEKMCRDEQDFDRLCNYVMYLGGKIVKRGYQVELNEFLNLVNINGFYRGIDGGGTGPGRGRLVTDDSGAAAK